MIDAHLHILLSAARRYAASPETRAHDARLMLGAAVNMLANETDVQTAAVMSLAYLEAAERKAAEPQLTTLRAASIT